VRQYGKTYAHPLVVLITAQGSQDTPRVGVVAGKRVGNAVQRNRAKRRIREGTQQLITAVPQHWDLLFLARRPICKASFLDIQIALKSLLQRANLLEKMDGLQSPDRLIEGTGYHYISLWK